MYALFKKNYLAKQFFLITQNYKGELQEIGKPKFDTEKGYPIGCWKVLSSLRMITVASLDSIK